MSAACPVERVKIPSGNSNHCPATSTPETHTAAAVFAQAGSGGKARQGGCPVHRGSGISPAVEGELNPANAMPATANQCPAPGQQTPLSTERVTSTIPTGGGSDPLWIYPSPQMFFNAMRRKGYAPREEEMQTVVAIHNSVNERTWSQVVDWEATLHPECVEGLRLLRFSGKPTEPTLKARLNSLVGYSPPFDRHDWVISRCGKEVTYLIDFYNGRPNPLKPVSMHIDARPSGDNFQELWDRVRMPLVQLKKALGMREESAESR